MAIRRKKADYRVRVRMYRQGLGDCFLLTFVDGTEEAHILIDFGSIGEQTTGVTLGDVAGDIVATTGARLAALVATHEHQDHVNGFLKEGDQLNEQALDVARVWLAWTEDARDEVAQALEKKQDDLLRAVHAGATALRAAGARGRGGMDQVERALAFSGRGLGVGKLATTVDEAMDWVTLRAKGGPTYLKPGTVLEPEWLPGIRVYVLGPPRSRTAINQLGDHGDAELYGLHSRAAADLEHCAGLAAFGGSYDQFRDRLTGDRQAALKRRLPFDTRFRVEAGEAAVLRDMLPGYGSRGDQWRRIDADWLAVASDLALQLDNATNNTSLVLAFEVIADGRVLLFPGDAQRGNWESWHEYRFEVPGKPEVTARELLDRTVLYKVGHHGSHNATLKGNGLELMRHEELVAMIPLDAKTASRKWPTAEWPARGVFEALMERAGGRVVRSDVGWAPMPDGAPDAMARQWRREQERVQKAGVVKVHPSYVDYVLR